jgi:thymidine kinase
MNSELHIILGPMFSGKSTYLLKTLSSLQNNCNSDSILLINHAIDNRYDNESNICTHDGVKMRSKSLSKLEDIYNIPSITLNNIMHVLIDEAQFFNDLYEVVKQLLFKYNFKIYIGGLDGDYKQVPFNNSKILDLIPYATSIIKLHAKCAVCNDKAPFTKRIIESNQKILVGGANDYKPVCIKHL